MAIVYEIREHFEHCELTDIDDEEFDRWLTKHDAELVARTLAAQSTGGVCKVFDAGLAWQDWVEDAGALINGEETNEL